MGNRRELVCQSLQEAMGKTIDDVIALKNSKRRTREENSKFDKVVRELRRARKSLPELLDRRGWLRRFFDRLVENLWELYRM